MGLPLYMLKQLQKVPLAQKIGLASLFSMAIIVIIFDILRAVYALEIGVVALDSIWNILEPSIAVMVSALPIYRALFTTRRKRDKTSYTNLTHAPHPRDVLRPGHELNVISV